MGWNWTWKKTTTEPVPVRQEESRPSIEETHPHRLEIVLTDAALLDLETVLRNVPGEKPSRAGDRRVIAFERALLLAANIVRMHEADFELTVARGDCSPLELDVQELLTFRVALAVRAQKSRAAGEGE